jgi:hypothetical protein
MSKLPEFEKKKEEILVKNESLVFYELNIGERKLLIEWKICGPSLVALKNRKNKITLHVLP